MTTKLKRDLILFDLDGTLVDSSPDIIWSANRTFVELGLPERAPAEIKDAIGWGVRMLIKGLLTEASDEEVEEARALFMNFYTDHLVVDSVLYPGVMETLEFLTEKRMAVVTNKPKALADEMLGVLGIERFFEATYGGDSFAHPKPNPEPLIKAMEIAGVRKEDSVFVGDSRVDIETGKSAGVLTVGAIFGFRGREELEESGADILIEEFKELEEIIDVKG